MLFFQLFHSLESHLVFFCSGFYRMISIRVQDPCSVFKTNFDILATRKKERSIIVYFYIENEILIYPKNAFVS